MISKIAFGCFFMIFSLLEVFSFDMKLIREIGDDRDEYMFFKIGVATLTPEKRIIVGDNGGHFIVTYDWNGTFIKRIGQPGQGPNDFNTFGGVVYHQGSLYVYDVLLNRMSVLDKDLNITRQFLTDCAISGEYFPIDHEHIICATSMINKNDKNGGKIKIIDRQGKTKFSFFSKSQLENSNKVNTHEDWLINYPSSMMKMHWSEKFNEILLTFKFANNPLKFFVLNKEGKEILTCSFNPGDRYSFPEALKKLSLVRPKGEFFAVKVNAVYIHDGKYYIFYDGTRNFEKGEELLENVLTIYDKNGNHVKKIALPLGLIPLDLSEDGYLLARNKQDLEPKLYIFKLD